MLMSLGSAKIFLFAAPCDMRKGAYSLGALVEQSGLNPHSGDLCLVAAVAAYSQHLRRPQ